MKLQYQVVSLELAKKLKELGAKRESYFKWNQEIEAPHHNDIYTETEWERYTEDFIPPDGEMYAAFTVAELGEMLPFDYTAVKHISMKRWYGAKTFVGRPLTCVDDENGNAIFGETEADARAKMLIYLIENKIIAV